MRKFFNSIQKKILFLLLVCFYLPLNILLWFSFESFSDDLENSYIENQKNLISGVTNRIGDYFQQIDNILLTMHTNIYVTTNYDWDVTDYNYYNLFTDELNSSLHSRDEFVHISYYIPEKNVLYYVSRTSSNSYFDAEYMKNIVCYQEVMEEGKSIVVQGYMNQELWNSDKYFTVVQKIGTFNNKNIGMLSVAVSDEKLVDMIDVMEGDEEAEIIIYDIYGQIIYTDKESDKSQRNTIFQKITERSDREGYFYNEYDGQKWLVFYSKEIDKGISIVKTIPVSEVVRPAISRRNSSMLISFVIVLILTTGIVWMLFRMMKPLKQVEYGMSLTEKGILDYRIEEKGNDEIGRIATAYNHMNVEMNELINSNYKYQLASQNARIKALQAQINPHFLYNVLQTIGGMALQKGCYDIEEITRSLAAILRYSIDWKDDKVTIRQELEIVQSYLLIQKTRFGNKIQEEIDCPLEYQNCMIIKFCIQPLVENAIIHGLEQKKGTGMLCVRISEEGKYLTVCVEDNGVGMPIEKRNQIIDMIKNGNIGNTDSIGLMNVYERCFLAYGDMFKMEIDSQDNQGTMLKLYLPLERIEE